MQGLLCFFPPPTTTFSNLIWVEWWEFQFDGLLMVSLHLLNEVIYFF